MSTKDQFERIGHMGMDVGTKGIILAAGQAVVWEDLPQTDQKLIQGLIESFSLRRRLKH